MKRPVIEEGSRPGREDTQGNWLDKYLTPNTSFTDQLRKVSEQKVKHHDKTKLS